MNLAENGLKQFICDFRSTSQSPESIKSITLRAYEPLTHLALKHWFCNILYFFLLCFYHFREDMEKVNIKFHDNYTVTYQHKKILQFVPELSVDRNLRVMTPNIPLLVR